MYISFFWCTFHSCSVANTNPISSGIWALHYWFNLFYISSITIAWGVTSLQLGWQQSLVVEGSLHEHKRRHQNSLPLTTNFSQKLTQPFEGISYPVGDLCRRFTKLTQSSAYTLHSNLIPQQMVQMAFCDLSHTFHKQVTNVSQQVFVILLWGILMSPLGTWDQTPMWQVWMVGCPLYVRYPTLPRTWMEDQRTLKAESCLVKPQGKKCAKYPQLSIIGQTSK